MTDVVIYTDGACSGNPGPGGWGAILTMANATGGDNEREMHGGAADTTNNRMELTACIEALNALKRPCSVTLWTDSSYVKDGITKWMENWKRNSWKTAAKKPVKNKELWVALDEARLRHQIDWRWIKGHAGHPMNERADALARQGTEEARAG